MSIKNIQIAEFERLVEHGTKLELLAFELEEDSYQVMAIDIATSVAYTPVTARYPQTPRTWRLDRLMKLLKSIGVEKCKIKNQFIKSKE